MLKKIYEYECIIPEIFNNKNTEILDTSLYEVDLFNKVSELNDLFVKFVSFLKEEEKSLYKYFKTQRFNLNQELVSDIEKKLTELNGNHEKLIEFWEKVNVDFFNHLKNRYQ